MTVIGCNSLITCIIIISTERFPSTFLCSVKTQCRKVQAFRWVWTLYVLFSAWWWKSASLYHFLSSRQTRRFCLPARLHAPWFQTFRMARNLLVGLWKRFLTLMWVYRLYCRISCHNDGQPANGKALIRWYSSGHREYFDLIGLMHWNNKIVWPTSTRNTRNNAILTCMKW